ncbi:uncharacterized protein [Drosophila bipectinata]|uniref:uncharacterized protein n=1 Tax=Drosophila bipectinata TaxID=42026 RepID=UPI0038B301FB
MGKDPSAVVLATALAFCAFCPFFARCDETELDIKKGIASLSKILVKYQAEFDRKVRFAQLQKAIGEIDKVMLEYNGIAKVKMPLIRSLNSAARLNYQNCVDPVFHWCRSINSTFDIFIRIFGDSNVSVTCKNIIWIQTVSALESGLENTGKSLEFLTNFRDTLGELKNAFKEMLHYVRDDFSPGGFYSEEKVELRKRNNRVRVGALFDAIGALVFGPIGLLLGLTFDLASFGITSEVQWNQKKTYEEQIVLIEHFFTVLTKEIENASEIVQDIESSLDEDRTNLHKLKGEMEGANNKKIVLMSDMPLRRVEFISNIQNLNDSCAEFVKWLEYDAPIYQMINSRMRLVPSTFYENEPSPA